MKRKAVFLCSLATLGLIFGTAVSVKGYQTSNFNLKADEGDGYSLTLNGDNSPLTSSCQLQATAQIGTPVFNYNLAKKVGNEHATLAPLGKLYNWSASDTYHGRISKISYITVNFESEGSLYIQYAASNDALEFSNRLSITSGEKKDVRDFEAYYFMLTAGNSEVKINSIVINYVCDETEMTYSRLANDFTGQEANGTVWHVHRSGMYAEIKTLNLASNHLYQNVLVEVIGNNVKFTIPAGGSVECYYNGTISDQGRKITFVSAGDNVGGAAKNNVPAIDLQKVYNVEDFEGYSETGNGYDQSHSYTQMSGLRGAFHSDYNATVSGKTSLFGNSSWSLMGSSDYLTLVKGKGVDGTRCALFKCNSNGLRYVTFDTLTNTPNGFKGSYFSFYAHGAYTGTSCATASTAATKIKVRLFYKNAITKVDDTVGTAAEFIVPAGSDWTQYTMPLDTSKTYYGYSIYSSNSTSTYLPIDNIQAYNVDPNATYVEPAPETNCVTFTGTGSATIVSAAQALLGETASAYFGLGSNGYAKVFVMGKNVNASNYEVDEEGHLSIDCDFSQDASPLGTLTITKIEGVFNEDNTAITNVKLSGNLIGSVIANNGSITINEATNYDLEESTANLQAAFTRWYDQGSGWVKDTTNSNRLEADKENAIHGTSSCSIRGYTKYSVTMTNDFPAAQTFSGMSLWIRNNTGKSLTVKLFIYKGTNLQSNVNPYAGTVVSADEWVHIQTGFTGGATPIYNVRLYFEMSGGAAADRINIDYISLY